MSLIRSYVLSTIKAGKLEEFMNEVPQFVEIVKSTEPNALQFECFVDKKQNEVIWLESFSNSQGAEFHLGNPALNEIQMKIMPLVEQINEVYYFGDASSSILDKLEAFGMVPNILNQWIGTERLTGQRASDNIQLFTKLEVNNMEDFTSLFTEIMKEAGKHEGCLFHKMYSISDSKAFACMELASEKAQLSWSEKFNAKFGEQFQTFVTKLEMRACIGTVPSNHLELLAKVWNAPIYQKLDGFTRYSS